MIDVQGIIVVVNFEFVWLFNLGFFVDFLLGKNLMAIVFCINGLIFYGQGVIYNFLAIEFLEFLLKVEFVLEDGCFFE